MNVASHSQNSCLTEIEAWVDRGREANTESRYAGQSALQGGDRLGWVAHIRRWRRCGQDRLVELIERRRPQPKLLSI